jgi:hypothetical protein
MSTFHAFITGASTMAFLAAAAFFARFWKETSDRLFVLFAIAFSALALNRALIVFYPVARESQPYVYLMRLFAFVLIAYAVIDKNRSEKR